MLKGKDLVEMYAILITAIASSGVELKDTERLAETIGNQLASAYDHSEEINY